MNNKTYEFPKNLICDVLNKIDVVVPNDAHTAVAFVLENALTEKESTALYLYYLTGMTLEQIAKHEVFKTTKSWVCHVINEGLRKLRHPDWIGYLVYGYNGELREKGKRPAAQKTEIKLNTLGLSCRAYNILFRAGCRTTGDVIRCGTNSIKSLHGMGVKTFNEIEDKILNAFGEMTRFEKMQTSNIEEVAKAMYEGFTQYQKHGNITVQDIVRWLNDKSEGDL